MAEIGINVGDCVEGKEGKFLGRVSSMDDGVYMVYNPDGEITTWVRPGSEIGESAISDLVVVDCPEADEGEQEVLV